MDANQQNNFLRYMSNPRSFTLKKWFYDLLGLKYSGHDQIIERVAAALTTDKDVEEFGTLISRVYETGYRKAVEDYRKEVERLGLNVHISDPVSKTS